MSTYVRDDAQVYDVGHPPFVGFDLVDAENVEVRHEQVLGAWRHFVATVVHQVGVVCGLETGVHG